MWQTMTARRFRSFIIATVVFAVILFTAGFSLSFAYWNAGGGSTQSVNGSVGQFYVNYDKPYLETPHLKDNIIDDEANSVVLQFKKSATDSTVVTVKFVFNVSGSPSNISQNDLFFHIWIDGVDPFTGWESAFLDNRESNIPTIRSTTAKYVWSEFTGFIIASKGGLQSSNSAVKSAIGATVVDNTVYTMTLTAGSGSINVSKAVAEPFSDARPVVKYGEEFKTLRQLKVEGKNTYKNYVCVKREYEYSSSGALVEAGPSSAYIEFEVAGDDLNATVTDFSVTRKRTSADGSPAGGDSPMTVYGSPVNKPLSSVNGNTYLSIDFGAGRDRFYDLEVSVTTSAAVSFSISAKATYRDTHEYKAANSYYLGVGDFSMLESLYIGQIESLDHIDASLTITLAAGDSFKLFGTSSGTGGVIEKDKYYGIKSKNASGAYVPNITFNPESIAADFVLPKNFAGTEANVGVAKSGKYSLHWHGSVSRVTGTSDYIVDALDITLVEPIENEEDLDEETVDAGYYVSGAFADNKTYKGLKMSAHKTVAGVYEKTTTALVAGNAYNIVYRATDGGATVRCGSFNVLDSAVGADGASIAFDAVTGGAPKLDFEHRFIVDFGGVDLSAASELTVNYRETVVGVSKTAELKAAKSGEFVGMYYADLSDTNIVSVTIKATSDTVRHNSFDINAVTVGRNCKFTGKSYMIKQTALVGSGNKANWTGVVNPYTDGQYDVDIPFGLNLSTVSNGYAIVYNKSGNAEYTFGNAFIPMRVSEDPDWDYVVDLDTREGRDHNVLIGKDLIIYHNGNAVSADLDDSIIRIVHEEKTHVYRIIDHEKAQGKFIVKVRKSFYEQEYGRYTDNLNISFIAGGAIDERPITQASAEASGYYIMGQFSGWEIYPSNKMTETNIYGVYTATLDSVITTTDIIEGVSGIKPGMFKIVYIPSSGTFTYYGATGGKVDVNGSGDSNMPITSATFFFDSFNSAHGASATKAYPVSSDLDKIYRIVYNNIDNGLTNLRVHYWDNDKTWGGGSTEKACNWTGGGTITSSAFAVWNNRPYMIDGGKGYYYYDVRSDAYYNGEYLTLGGIKLSHADGSDANQSIDFMADFASANGVGNRSYIIRYEKATNTWSGSAYKGVDWDYEEFAVPTGDEEVQKVKLGSGEQWAVSYTIVEKNALEAGWYFGAYVGASRQLVGVEMSTGWGPSVNIYGHIFPKPENNPIERVALSQAAIDLLESASATHPVNVLFVRDGEWVKVYASDDTTSMHLGSVSLRRFMDNNESDVIDGVGIYDYTDDFGYGWRNKTPVTAEDWNDGFVDMFGNPTITDIKWATGERAIAYAVDEYKITLSKTDCTTDRDLYFIGDYITLTANAPQAGTVFSHFEVDGEKISGNAFLAVKSLHRVKAVYVGVSRIVIEEHEEYIRTTDGFVRLPTAQIIAPDGSVDTAYTLTTTVEDSENKQYTVTDGVADVSWYVGSIRLKITYYARGLAGRDTEITYLTVQRDTGDAVTVFNPMLRSIGLIDDAGRGDVEFDARVKHGDDVGSIKFTPNSDEYGIWIEDFDYVGYDRVEFYVYTENAKSGMFAGTFWAHDTDLVSGEWVKVSVDLKSDIYLKNNNGEEIRPNTDGTALRGRFALRIRNGKDTPVWISSVKAYKTSA